MSHSPTSCTTHTLHGHLYPVQFRDSMAYGLDGVPIPFLGQQLSHRLLKFLQENSVSRQLEDCLQRGEEGAESETNVNDRVLWNEGREGRRGEGGEEVGGKEGGWREGK